MGIVGWADAPNTTEDESVSLESAQSESIGTILPPPAAPVLEEIVQVSSDDNSFEGGEDEDEYVGEESISRSIIPLDDWEDDQVSEAAIELMNAIRGLRLCQSEQGGSIRCDISKFELHEVKFLFDHAERCGFDGYFSVVREVFGVKHRIIDEGLDIDSVDSSNLDDLLSYVEAKYEKAYDGEE